MGPEELVWYACYGSNLDEARLGYYLSGGTPAGSTVVNGGARDPRPPRDRRPLSLPGRVYFAKHSSGWGGGGVAFYDPDLDGPAPARAYLLTVEQFEDVAAQEGPWYVRRLECGELDGHPVRSFTAPWSRVEAEPTRPAGAYLATMGRGLVAGHGWTPEEVAAHLCGLDGCAGAWDPAEVAALLTG